MNNKLKILYNHLVDNRIHEHQDWHDRYKKFYDEVDEIRQRINAGKPLNSESDEPFLRKLLYETYNGIASRGHSRFSGKNFNLFIGNNNFLSSLSNFIANPQIELFEQFQKAWEDQEESNNPLLINRVAAACTLDVSTTVDNWRFDKIFNWLIKDKVINEPSANLQGWFAKNQFLLSEFKKEFQKELNNGTTDDFYLSIFVWELWELYMYSSNPFRLEKQIIKYGPPGTGKTYLALQQTESFFNIWKDEFAPASEYRYEDHKVLVQFHPSFSYEDFMEGLRPILNDNGDNQLTLQNGIFKEFCRKAGQWEIETYKQLSKNNEEKEWQELTIGDLRNYENALTGAHWKHIFKIQDSSKRVVDAVPPFFFIIDEINRADLSRVLGELMYCLEYRGVKASVKTQYANLNNKENGLLSDESGEYKFFIPSNVYLIGTMNNIDRSVESFDFALRRRFRWEEMTPDYTLLKHHLNQYHGEWTGLANNFKSLNEEIAKETLLGTDYQIGHAYFMNLKYQTHMSIDEVRTQIWKDRIRPLLEEYLRGTGQTEELLGTFKRAFGI